MSLEQNKKVSDTSGRKRKRNQKQRGGKSKEEKFMNRGTINLMPSDGSNYKTIFLALLFEKFSSSCGEKF